MFKLIVGCTSSLKISNQCDHYLLLLLILKEMFYIIIVKKKTYLPSIALYQTIHLFILPLFNP